MRFLDYEWDEINVEHIARHGLCPEDVESACYNEPLTLRGRGGRYLVYGRTEAGRYIMVMLANKGRGLARPITARDMNEGEKALYRRRRHA